MSSDATPNPVCEACKGRRFDHAPGCAVPCGACGWEPEHGHKSGCPKGPLESGQTRWHGVMSFRGYDTGEDLAERIRRALGTHPTLSLRVDAVEVLVIETAPRRA